jgi:hypothetical protein
MAPTTAEQEEEVRALARGFEDLLLRSDLDEDDDDGEPSEEEENAGSSSDSEHDGMFNYSQIIAFI